MTWWTWGLIAWSLLASVGIFWLAVMCSVRRRRTRGDHPVVWSVRLPAAGEAQEEMSGNRSGPPTQPLAQLRPLAPRADAPAQDDPPSTALERLLEGARAGDYTLPAPLLQAVEGHHRLRELEIPAPRGFGRADAASHLVTDATAGGPLDPLALCARIHRSRADLLLVAEAHEVVALAVAQAQDAAGGTAGDMSRRIVEDHLRPAHEDVLRLARSVALRLGRFTDEDFELDTTRIVSAGRRVRSAYSILPGLVRRHRSVLEARDAVNALGGHRPRHDSRDLFAFVRDPLAYGPPGLAYDRTPEPPMPHDDTARLLWLVSDRAAPARPWLPTVAQQDAAWLACFEAPAGSRRYSHIEPSGNRTSPRRARWPRPRPESGPPDRAEDRPRVGRVR